MPQRYNIVDTNLGVNLYQTYSNVGYPTSVSPSPRSQLGMAAGNWFNGNLGTTWMLADMAAGQASVAAGGTIYLNPSSTPPFQATLTTVTGGITGTVVVSVPATPATLAGTTIPGVTGVWAETSGKTLNTTMTLDLPAKHANEKDADYQRRIGPWLLMNRVNLDGTPMTDAQVAAAEGPPVPPVQHPSAAPPVHPSQQAPR